MAVFKCKMCGGTLEIKENETVAVCEYCDSRQTLPRFGDEQKLNLYDRANHFRRNNDYDKAMAIYEQILNSDSTDAEAYWSLVLCRYGIEYVEDPATRHRIPTVNRTQLTSIYADENYKAAVRYADPQQKALYEEEAGKIDEIQRGILAISQNEEPFDIFICYKETDANGRRTPDSVLANDLYYQLTNEGFKVFFSRITLEDKLGTAYEPYIFAALNSAKIMVVLGTRRENFDAVWVKNEWSRFLSLIKSGADKVLIPAYRDMDPYDLPEEFSHLQAQDMSKLGFMQDLLRGIRKISGTETAKEVEVKSGSGNVEALLKRVFIFLEDGEFASADSYCEKVLDIEPENARAYLGKLMAEKRVRTPEALIECSVPFTDSKNYRKALRYADDELFTRLERYHTQNKERLYRESQATEETSDSAEKKEQKEQENSDIQNRLPFSRWMWKVAGGLGILGICMAYFGLTSGGFRFNLARCVHIIYLIMIVGLYTSIFLHKFRCAGMKRWVAGISSVFIALLVMIALVFLGMMILLVVIGFIGESVTEYVNVFGTVASAIIYSVLFSPLSIYLAVKEQKLKRNRKR